MSLSGHFIKVPYDVSNVNIGEIHVKSSSHYTNIHQIWQKLASWEYLVVFDSLQILNNSDNVKKLWRHKSYICKHEYIHIMYAWAILWIIPGLSRDVTTNPVIMIFSIIQMFMLDLLFSALDDFHVQISRKDTVLLRRH